jgi:hypothetical protein
VAARRGEVEELELRPADHLGERPAVEEDLVQARPLDVVPGDADGGAGVALRVDIDEQRPALGRGERGGEVHRRRGLADAALLVRDGEDPGHLRACVRGSTALEGSEQVGVLRLARGGREPGQHRSGV